MPRLSVIHHIYFSFFLLLPIIFNSGCKDAPKYRIGVSQCSTDDWRQKMNEEILREMIFHDNATVEILSGDDNNEKQIADIRYFIDNGFDIIIAAPNEANALTPIIKEAYDSGIPVLLFDRNINGDSYTAFQGADNYDIGRRAAELAANLTSGNASVIEIRGLSGSSPAAGRHNGFADVAGNMPGITILGSGFGDWNAEKARHTADSLLTRFPQTNLIYAHNDRMAIAAAQVAREKGIDTKIIGVDAAPQIGIQAVADSIIDATFLYPTDGYRLIRTALNILEGEPYERNTILPLASVVDLSNAEILLMQNAELKEGTEKISWLKSRIDHYWAQYSAQKSLLYAVIAIMILLCVALALIIKVSLDRRRHHQALAEQNMKLAQQRDQVMELNEQLSEATQSKLMFFTNVSHDLRTPLTLIAGPIEQLAEADNLTESQKNLIKLANKNTTILMRLINQILDFRKYENGKLELNLTEVNIGQLFAEWCESFVNIASRKGIGFNYSISCQENTTIAIDVDKIERVMFNLISNAFKYTPAGGDVSVSIADTDNNIVIKVSDTGIGISRKDLAHIFERFFQVDKVRSDGAGIGLALTKAFVEMHRGKLSVDSTQDKGSCFTVELPVRHVQTIETVDSYKSLNPETEMDDYDADNETENAGERTSVLVIDDNSDVRALVKNILSDDYEVYTASTGEEGIRKAEKHVPDLIISDIMMPGIDGYECCRRLKTDSRTSHIPVLLLTACNRDEQRAEGYENGADAFLAKPFPARLLKARCKSLIDNRMRIKEMWPEKLKENEQSAENTEQQETAAENSLGPIDREFYNRFSNVVSQRLSDPDLSVDTLAAELGLGRTQFYRKIKAITGLSPVELLRNMRLERARDMLVNTGKTISEIAYEVGFSSPAYFGKCYKDRYNQTPSEIRETK